MVEINGKTYEFKYSLRSMFVWESITDKPFEIKTLMDLYILVYACIIANQNNPSLEFDELIDYADTHPEVIESFNEFMNGELKKRESITPKKKAVRPRKNNSQ